MDDVLALLRKEFDQDDIFNKDDSDFPSDLDSKLSDTNYPEPKKKVYYRTNPCFTALMPCPATFPLQEVSFDLQL